MSEYLTWRTEGGEVFDPWVRLHLALGAAVLGIASPSMTITGSLADWRSWTGLPLACPAGATAEHVIPFGLVPLVIDGAAGTAVYQEPNVWMAHPIQ
jgi:hypothetical protein